MTSRGSSPCAYSVRTTNAPWECNSPGITRRVVILVYVDFRDEADKSGNIIVEGFDGEEGFIYGEMVLGILIEIIPFKGERREKLFDGLIGDYDWLKGMIKESIEFYKSNNEIPAERKNKVVPELERRLRTLG